MSGRSMLERRREGKISIPAILFLTAVVCSISACHTATYPQRLSLADVLDRANNVPIIAVFTDNTIFISNFDTGAGRIPQSCLTYRHFQFGPAQTSPVPRAGFWAFRISAGDYVVQASAIYDNDLNLPKVLSIRFNDKLLLLAVRGSSPFANDAENQANISLLKASGFRVAGQLRSLSPSQAVPPICATF